MWWLQDVPGTYPCTPSCGHTSENSMYITSHITPMKTTYNVTLLYCRRHGGLCDQIFTRGSRNVEHTVISSREGMTTLLIQKAGADTQVWWPTPATKSWRTKLSFCLPQFMILLAMKVILHAIKWIFSIHAVFCSYKTWQSGGRGSICRGRVVSLS